LRQLKESNKEKISWAMLEEIREEVLNKVLKRLNLISITIFYFLILSLAFTIEKLLVEMISSD